MKANSLRNEVRNLLRLDTMYRNNDKMLVLQVWSQHGLNLTKEQRLAFLSAPGADSVLRRRREMSVYYPASAEVTERRYKQYKNYTEEFSKGHWFNRIMRKRGV